MHECDIIDKIYTQIKTELKEYNRYKELKYPFKGSKFIRGSITYSISKQISISVIPEYLHTSSIVIDDLPCMDADIIRRGRPSMHAEFGEAVAKLTSYSLVLIALRKIHEFQTISARDEARQLLLDQFSLGLLNVINGQYQDLFLHKKIETYAPRVQKMKILGMIEEKTGELFGIAFLLGYLYRSKTLKQWKLVKQSGIAFGVCYQIIDDLDDFATEKDKKQVLNIFKIYSRNEVIELFSLNLDTFRNLSITSGIHNQYLEYLYNNFLDIFKTKIKQIIIK